MPTAPMIVDGDRAAGKVISTTGATKLGLNEINWSANGAEAVRRCQEWGYAGAEPFEGITTDLLGHDPIWGTPIWRYTRVYQCVTSSGGLNEFPAQMSREQEEEIVRQLRERGVSEQRIRELVKEFKEEFSRRVVYRRID